VLETGEFLFAKQDSQTTDVFAATVDEYVPAAHSVQLALPVIFLNFPATQAEHVPPSGPVYPGIHLQSEIVLNDVEKGEYAF